jgi:hypothetical protein
MNSADVIISNDAFEPTLNKDPRLVNIEAFYRVNFGGKQQGALIKSEILKLQNGSKEYMG